MRSVWRYFFPEGKHRAQYLQLMRDSEEYRNSDDGAWEYTDMFEYINEPDPDHQTDGGNTVRQDPGSPGDPGPPRAQG